MRVSRQIRRERRQDARSGLDQQHPRLARVDVPELIRQGHVGKLGDGAGELDAGGAAADDHEGEPCAAQRLVGLALGALEGEQDAPPDRGCILERFQRRARKAPTRRGRNRRGARRSRARASRSRSARRPRAAPRGRPHRLPTTVPSKRGDVLAPAKQLADRPGDLRGGQRGGPDLVEQRLEEMMIALIDDGDAHARALESLRDGESAEAAADDHHVVRGDLAHDRASGAPSTA